MPVFCCQGPSTLASRNHEPLFNAQTPYPNPQSQSQSTRPSQKTLYPGVWISSMIEEWQGTLKQAVYAVLYLDLDVKSLKND